MLSWDDDFTALPTAAPDAPFEPLATAHHVRLDTLLPQNAETGAVTTEAFQVYLNTMMDMVSRAAQPLSVIMLAVDDSPAVRFFGSEGVGLIGRAIVRCVRQETRPHDVVGLALTGAVAGIPAFVIACPLMNEEQTAQLGTRLCSAMTATAEGAEGPWLTISVGAASLSLDLNDAGALLARAESALNRAQRMGGGIVWRHTDTLRRIIEQDDTAPDDRE